MNDQNKTALRPPDIIVIMGVAGSGKTTVGSLLAHRLELPFYDADDFHPPANVEKLSQDIPLTDEDREPWLKELTRRMKRWSDNGGAVLACSALKHSYRKQLRTAADRVEFVFLEGDAETIARRLTRRAQRANHIVKKYKSILEKQFADLEIPSDAMKLSIYQPPDQIVDEILTAFHPSSY